MRYIVFLLLINLFLQPAFSQSPSKQEMQKQIGGTIKELNDQIADLEKQIAEAKKNKEDEETIKDLEEQVTILKKQVAMMGGLKKGISNISEKTIRAAAEQENNRNTIPVRDAARINMLPKKILSDAELNDFIKKTTVMVEGVLPSKDKLLGKRLYDTLQKIYKSPEERGNYALACMLNGNDEIALYLIGRVCLDDMSHTDNLNNYAAYLNMTGGEQFSLPVLQNLNRHYPFNSTILNNIGQAWFGLGEIDKANLYLDSALMIYPFHSKANETKSLIEKSKGNTEKAIELLRKSMDEAYSDEKKSKLIEMGDKDACDNVRVRYPKPAHALGIDKIIAQIPQYPTSNKDAALRIKEWESFRAAIDLEAQKLAAPAARCDVVRKEWGKKLMNPALKQAMLRPYNNPIYKTANCKFLEYMEWSEPLTKNLVKHNIDVLEKTENLKSSYYEKLGNAKTCAEQNAVYNEYIPEANRLWNDFNMEVIKRQRQFFNEGFIHMMYSMMGPPELWDLQIAKTKLEFLSIIRNLMFVDIRPCSDAAEIIDERRLGKLPDFDELHCDYHDVFYLPGWKFTSECNRMKTECNLVVIKCEMEDNFNTREWKGTVELGISKSIGKEMGPLSAEAKVEAGMFLEWSNEGFSDAGLSAGVKTELGISTPEEIGEMLKTETETADKISYGSLHLPSAGLASAEIKIGINSGIKAEGGGILHGLEGQIPWGGEHNVNKE